MSEKKYPYQEIDKAMGSVRMVASDLESLARAFRRVGNHDLAIELENSVDVLRTSSAEIDAASCRWLSEGVRDARQASANLFNGVMAGIDLGRKSKEGA